MGSKTEAQSRMVGELKAALPKAVEDANAAIGRLRALFRELVEKNLFPTGLGVAPEKPSGEQVTHGKSPDRATLKARHAR